MAFEVRDKKATNTSGGPNHDGSPSRLLMAETRGCAVRLLPTAQIAETLGQRRALDRACKSFR